MYHTYMHIYIYVHVYMYIHVCIHVYISTYIYIYTCIYVYTCIYTCIYIFVTIGAVLMVNTRRHVTRPASICRAPYTRTFLTIGAILIPCQGLTPVNISNREHAKLHESARHVTPPNCSGSKLSGDM